MHNALVKSIDPTKTVRGYNLPCETSYFHFNHRVPLPLLFPPVFTVNDEWLGEELVYDRSRFLERHEAPSLAREAEGLQSAEDVIHATHETSEQKEERQPSKRTRRVNRTKTTPTTTLTTKEKTSAHNVTPTKDTPVSVQPATPATPAPPMTTLATPVTPASMLVTPASSREIQT